MESARRDTQAVLSKERYKPLLFPYNKQEKGGVYTKREGKARYLLAGAAAGLANGFFGGGGGSILVPALTRLCGMETRRAFATSVAVILPLCALSAGLYLLRGGLELSAALPYLLGGALGGWLGGRLFRGVRLSWLRRGFGLLLVYGGVRCIL